MSWGLSIYSFTWTITVAPCLVFHLSQSSQNKIIKDKSSINNSIRPVHNFH